MVGWEKRGKMMKNGHNFLILIRLAWNLVGKYFLGVWVPMYILKYLFVLFWPYGEKCIFSFFYEKTKITVDVKQLKQCICLGQPCHEVAVTVLPSEITSKSVIWHQIRASFESISLLHSYIMTKESKRT